MPRRRWCGVSAKAQLAARRPTRQDAAAARVLARGADQDVAGLRDDLRDFRQASTTMMNAMREDLADLRDRTADGFTEVRARLDTAAAGQQHIVGLLRTLIQRRRAGT